MKVLEIPFLTALQNEESHGAEGMDSNGVSLWGWWGPCEVLISSVVNVFIYSREKLLHKACSTKTTICHS